MRNIFMLLFIILPALILTINKGNHFVSYAEQEEDPIEEEEVEVEGENDVEEVLGGDDDIIEEKLSTSSPDAETTLLFVKPTFSGSSQYEIPAGRLVEFLVGFRNKGKESFIVETLDASFRYPMDYSYHIQNFTTSTFNKQVEPREDATFTYAFLPSDAFGGRPFGLHINLAYRDVSGNSFHDALFNETVQVVEIQEGFDGETFFLYVFLAAGVILLLVIGQQTLLSVGRKRIVLGGGGGGGRKAPVETGTSNPNNVDYDWLPKQTLATLNKERSQKSPKAAKPQSPRQRKTQRKAGSE